MKSEIIPISRAKINGAEANAVNARDLHEFLQIGKDFSNWIKSQIDRAGLEYGVDYVKLAQKGERSNGNKPALQGLYALKGEKVGHRPSIDYILTLDAAKHIALMSHTERGRQARAYLIEVEKRFRAEHSGALSGAIPAEILQVLETLAKTQEAMGQTLDTMAKEIARINSHNYYIEEKMRVIAGDYMDKREAANKRLLTIKTKRKDQIRGTRLTPREKERIIRMHKEGWSNIQIAREIGRSDSAVSAALKRAKQ